MFCQFWMLIWYCLMIMIMPKYCIKTFFEGIWVFCVLLKHCRFLGYLVSKPIYHVVQLNKHPTISGVNIYLEKCICFLIFPKKYLFLANIQIGNIFAKSTNFRWVQILKQVPQPVYNAQMPVLCFFGNISTWTQFIQTESHQIWPFHVELYW